MSTEDDIFADAMRGVQAASGSTNKITKASPITSRSARSILREHAKPAVLVEDMHHSSHIPLTQHHDEPWTWRASGVSASRLKQLAQTSIPDMWELDLHGMTRDAALVAAESFLLRALSEAVREVCIVHGRGLHSSGKAILKVSIYQWLRVGPLASRILVLMPRPGTAGGACLILLRKEEK